MTLLTRFGRYMERKGASYRRNRPRSYRSAVGPRNYSKTRRAIRSGTFRGFHLRNGRSAPY